MSLVADLDEKICNKSTLSHPPKENVSVEITAKITGADKLLENNCCMTELPPL